ncbi:DUF3617 domain-containing protein [uncultured Sphingomonas sp.]|uniref:DUF3617 domain-containing protein n=1 Tax=uncultured Sphingomonas sp. TaxID=158754 RepID=UPI0035CC415E
MGWTKRLALAGCAAASVLVSGAAGPLGAITMLQPGQWQFHEFGNDGRRQSVCVRDPMALIQFYHPGIACTRFVIDDTANSATVHYTCPGRGYGRTTITTEDPQLIKLETQGIAEGQPFDYTYEGRRTGACARR